MTPAETIRLVAAGEEALNKAVSSGDTKHLINHAVAFAQHATQVVEPYARRLIRLREIYDAGLLLSVKEIELAELLTFDERTTDGTN